MPDIFHLKSLSQLHQLLACKPPCHPLISFIRYRDMKINKGMNFSNVLSHFYILSLKKSSGKVKYGRNYYDFQEGTMMFTGPNQLLQAENLESDIEDLEGWSLFIHPDLFFGTHLGNTIGSYNYFSYEINEALHLSEKERAKILHISQNIEDEYKINMDSHSNELIVSNVELLLNYCRRYYDRQFLTRKKQNKGIVTQIESLLNNYFQEEKSVEKGLPTVKYCASVVNLSPNYLSDLLKKETGKSTKEYIDFYLIKAAKQKLLVTEKNINEIAYELGFEHAKSFSKLFKKKVGQTPKEYRNASRR